MIGFLIKEIKTGKLVASYQDGNQSNDDVLIANNFDQGEYECLTFNIEEGYLFTDYDETTLLLKEEAKELKKQRKFNAVISKNVLIFDALLNEINKLRKLLDLPDSSKADILDYFKSRD